MGTCFDSRKPKVSLLGWRRLRRLLELAEGLKDTAALRGSGVEEKTICWALAKNPCLLGEPRNPGAAFQVRNWGAS